MKNSYDPINVEYQKKEHQKRYVRIMLIFFVLLFFLVPLAEIVPDFDYCIASSFSSIKYSCIVGWELLEPLSFK